MEDLEQWLRILFASHVLKKDFDMFRKYYMLALFEGKHGENLHVLSPDKAQTQRGRIDQITVTNTFFLSTSVLSLDLENELLLSAIASGISVSGFSEISL